MIRFPLPLLLDSEGAGRGDGKRMPIVEENDVFSGLLLLTRSAISLLSPLLLSLLRDQTEEKKTRKITSQ